MALDSAIVAIFGQPPENIDLSEQSTTANNTVSVTFFVVACLCVALRFYIRIGKKTVGIDDYTVIVGLISTAALLFTTILAGQLGAGKHVWTNDVNSFVTLLKVVYAEPYVYAVAVTTTKISILLLYRRLFHAGSSVTNHLFAGTYWTAAGLTILYPIIMFTTMAASCQPTSYNWERYLGSTEGKCIDIGLFYFVIAIINMVVDVIILGVPIPRIMALQLNKRDRSSIIGIMLLGGFVCVASVFRIYYLRRLENSTDVTWWMGPGMAWSSIEPSVAIISACLPTFAPLLRMSERKQKNALNAYYNRSRSLPNHYGVSRATVSHAVGKSEDEVELTRGGRRGCAFDSGSNSSDTYIENSGGIVVDTEVFVSTDHGPL
ncbi:hypothetical protein VPNG_05533 [Cytospora leucostoma]|uniref:Rhodopsin domain-containing protein n=1 Tax=Cytospora leucostoma TaxID=1230097 RepID=A0A423XBJ5_9PEZI|nr:hypothetical protein VPNG_05533 [Cytospora leucostoma]